MIAIVMRDEFRNGVLPEEPTEAAQPSDKETYKELYHTASIIFQECLVANSQKGKELEAGWLPAGKLKNALSLTR